MPITYLALLIMPLRLLAFVSPVNWKDCIDVLFEFSFFHQNFINYLIDFKLVRQGFLLRLLAFYTLQSKSKHDGGFVDGTLWGIWSFRHSWKAMHVQS